MSTVSSAGWTWTPWSRTPIWARSWPRSTGGVASDVLDAALSQAVGLDQLVDRWVRRILRRKQPGPAAPPALLPAQPAVTPAQAVP